MYFCPIQGTCTTLLPLHLLGTILVHVSCTARTGQFIQRCDTYPAKADSQKSPWGSLGDSTAWSFTRPRCLYCSNPWIEKFKHSTYQSTSIFSSSFPVFESGNSPRCALSSAAWIGANPLEDLVYYGYSTASSFHPVRLFRQSILSHSCWLVFCSKSPTTQNLQNETK